MLYILLPTSKKTRRSVVNLGESMPFPEGSKVWSKLVLIASVICIFCALLAIFGVRFGAFNFRVASDMLESTFQSAVAVLVVAVIIFVGEAETRLRSGLAVILLLVPILGIWFNKMPESIMSESGMPIPPLNDVTTDTQNPPLFDAIISIRPESSNSLVFSDTFAKIQAEHYPDIRTIDSELSHQTAFDKALKLVNQAGWEVVLEDKALGKIEAVATSFFFAFKDDVVIRIQSNEAGSLLDIRSHSRVGHDDRGANAERIRTFIENFNQG